MTAEQEAWLIIRKLLMRLENIAALRLGEITKPPCSLNDAVLRLDWAVDTLNKYTGIGNDVDNYLVENQERGQGDLPHRSHLP